MLLGIRTMRQPAWRGGARRGSAGVARRVPLDLCADDDQPDDDPVVRGGLRGLGLAVGSSFTDALVLTLAVLLGSSLWWVVLTSIVGWLRLRVSTTALLWVNRISGAALVVFGVVAIVTVLT